MTKNKNSSEENFEFGIDSRYRSKKEKGMDSIQLMNARLERLKSLSNEEIIRAKLMQLKLEMEDFLSKSVYDNQNHFGQFLGQYIDSIYSKRSEFANDINITPNLLSKIINHHREPNEEFFYRLMIHSEKAFKKVGEFQKQLWIQVYYHEKICDTMADQDKWKPEIEKQIKFSEL